MIKKKILYICGSLNQTMQMHQISRNLSEYENFFTPFYADGIIDFLVKKGMLDFSILAGQFRKSTENYLNEHKLQIDYKGADNDYDLVFLCTDLIVPHNIKNKNLILIQEGMTDPENLMYYFAKYLKLPRFFASTSTTGLSDCYNYFCVASKGYEDLFIKKGVKPEKIRVTGIPNFDNIEQFKNNQFPFSNYVLAATSDARETFKLDNRKKFIREVLQIASGKDIIFKLHPNEDFDRASLEIKEIAPEASIFTGGNINHMVANCCVLVTQYSSVAFIGLALGKQVYSYFQIDKLKKLVPVQNGGTSARNIAIISKQLLEGKR